MKGDIWTPGESVEVPLGKRWRLGVLDRVILDRGGKVTLEVLLNSDGSRVRVDGNECWKSGERKESAG